MGTTESSQVSGRRYFIFFTKVEQELYCLENKSKFSQSQPIFLCCDYYHFTSLQHQFLLRLLVRDVPHVASPQATPASSHALTICSSPMPKANHEPRHSDPERPIGHFCVINISTSHDLPPS